MRKWVFLGVHVRAAREWCYFGKRVCDGICGKGNLTVRH